MRLNPLATRRRLLQETVAGAGLLFLTDGCTRPSIALRPWDGPSPDERDPLMVALAYALLAPSPHNAQSWRVDLRLPGQVHLYVDRERLLLASDPLARQVHLGQGTFLELLDLAAREQGFDPRIEYFPSGEYAGDVVEDRPVAAVRLVPDVAIAKDPLFGSIRQRCTNKLPYDGRPLAAGVAERLVAAGTGDGLRLRVIDAPDQKARLAALARDAMAVEVAGRDRDEELAQWFRFSDREVEQKRDGFGLGHSGRVGIAKWFAETFIISRGDAKKPKGNFSQQSVALLSDQARSASAFGLLVSGRNTRRDQVLAGRRYARVQLTATSIGLRIHPLSQILQEYPDMTTLQKEFKKATAVADSETAQMFFRIGHAPATLHTPRRDLRDLFRQR
jgi:hypothetical protein